MTLKALFVIAVGLFFLSKFCTFDEDPGGRGSTARSRKAKRLREEREKARALGEGRIVRDEDDEDEQKDNDDAERDHDREGEKEGKAGDNGNEKSTRKEANANNANATNGNDDIDSDEDDEAKARNKANEANAKLAELLLANAVRADKTAAERKRNSMNDNRNNPKPATVTRSSAAPKTQADFADLMATDGLDDDAILEGIPKLSPHEAKSLLKYMTGNLEKLTSQVERKMGG
jgi:hypothetical protein